MSAQFKVFTCTCGSEMIHNGNERELFINLCLNATKSNGTKEKIVS